GRFVHNGWLQEMPDPVTKLTWDNAALVSPKTARELGLAQDDVIELSLGERSVGRIAVFVLPGQADYAVSVHFGHGRMPIPDVLSGGGFDVYPLRETADTWFAAGLRLRKTGERYALATTQEHGIIPQGRAELIIRQEPAGEFPADHPPQATGRGGEASRAGEAHRAGEAAG